MSGQYQERIEYFNQYREKNKERLQQKRHDYYEENNDRIKEYGDSSLHSGIEFGRSRTGEGSSWGRKREVV